MKWKGFLLAIISAVSYGLIPLFILPIKQADFSLDTTLFYRFFIAAIMVMILVAVKNEKLIISFYQLKILVVLGLLYALSSEFLFMGYDELGAGVASTILFAYPVFITLILFFIYKEVLSIKTIIALCIAMAGIFILGFGEEGTQIRTFGLVITLLSALCYASYMLVVNKTDLGVSGLKLTFYSLLFSSIYYAIKILILDDAFQVPNIEMVINFSIFAFVTTVISTSTMIYAIKQIGSTPVAIMGALEPVVAILVSVLFFQEDFTLRMLIGVILILIGISVSLLNNRT